jgi:hypothetical protein
MPPELTGQRKHRKRKKVIHYVPHNSSATYIYGRDVWLMS